MIKADGLRYQIGSFSLDANLEVKDNEYFVLLGLTGSGKTLFLECLCGLRISQAGRICIGDRDVAGLEPRDRGVGYVPQDGALFEHLDVAGNLAFALGVKGGQRDLRTKTAVEMAARLGITHLLERGIRGLSGGERQRVALGRALCSRPVCLMLDEPVSALDEYTRENVCNELKNLQREFKLSAIHVCHSFEEARLVADRIGIMHEGRIIQTGTAEELVNSPKMEAAARILRTENLLLGEGFTENGTSMIRVGGRTLLAPVAQGEVRFCVRSWQIQPLPRFKDQSGLNVFSGEVTDVRLSGISARIQLRSDIPLIFHLSRHEADVYGVKEGAKISVAFPPDAIHVLEKNA